jgi:hypothetical protein
MSNQICQMASISQKHMYKSWIRSNPELALKRVTEFCSEAQALGMMLRYYEDDHYVDIVAAYNESDLDKRYA